MANNDYTSVILLIIFGLSASVQLYFYIFIFGAFTRHKSKTEKLTQVPVSIVICARNEAENLEKYLPAILEQHYPNYEVVVVNDCSEDDTEDVLKRFCARYPHLRTTFIKEDEKFRHGKKLALTVGIKSAKNEWMLLTDADCLPTSNMWLSNMAANFAENAEIVLGYGGFVALPGLLNKTIRFDAAFIALQYFAFALIGKPYMGVGRNLAYKRSLFFANKGFASHARLHSGDDDLFVNEVATSNNTRIEWHTNAHTRSESKKTFEGWIDQKKRHFSTFARYQNIHKTLLASEILSRILFYISVAGLLITLKFWLVALIIFFVRAVVQLITLYFTFKKLNEKNLLLISLLLDIAIPFINFAIYLSNKIRPQRQWR